MAEPKREPKKNVPLNCDRGDEQVDPSALDGPSDETTLSGDEESALAGTPPDGTPLAEDLAKLRAEKDELQQTLVRRQADFENYRKRVERDRHEEGRRGVERLIGELIPVLDAFDRAIQAHNDPAFEEYSKGVSLIRKQLWEALARHGLERIDASGKIFDPHVHQAIERAESSEHPDGYVLDVFQDGYVFHGRVLRPAMVRVVVHPSGNDA